MYSVITDCSVKITLAGCGRIAQNHFQSIEKHTGDIELAGIADTNPAVLARHEKKIKYSSMFPP